MCLRRSITAKRKAGGNDVRTKSPLDQVPAEYNRNRFLAGVLAPAKANPGEASTGFWKTQGEPSV